MRETNNIECAKIFVLKIINPKPKTQRLEYAVEIDKENKKGFGYSFNINSFYIWLPDKQEKSFEEKIYDKKIEALKIDYDSCLCHGKLDNINDICPNIFKEKDNIIKKLKNEIICNRKQIERMKNCVNCKYSLLHRLLGDMNLCEKIDDCIKDSKWELR